MRNAFFNLTASLLALFAISAHAAQQGCDVQVTGSKNIHLFIPYKHGETGASSDYWLAAGQKKAGNETLDKAFNQKTAPNSETLVGPIMFSCRAPDGKIKFSIYPSSANKAVQVVYGPKNYMISDGFSTKPDHLTLMLMKVDGDRYDVDGPGTLKISKFDGTGIAGTIEWTATQHKTDNHDKFVVSFDFPCFGDLCKK